MELPGVIGLFMHFDQHLMAIIQYCGAWTYLVIFGIIFAETGFVLTPFLPGGFPAFCGRGFFSPRRVPAGAYGRDIAGRGDCRGQR